MDREFQRALIVVLIGGTSVVAAGAVTLYFVFRRFGNASAGGNAHMALIAALVTFVLLACAALFALSYSRW